jgi:hypothetical protein
VWLCLLVVAYEAKQNSCRTQGRDAAGTSYTCDWKDACCCSAVHSQQRVLISPSLLPPAGISVILTQLLGQLPSYVPSDPEQCKAALSAARSCVEELQQLLEAAALTLADALLDRCKDARHRVQLLVW